MKYLEAQYLKDPVVFQWINAKRNSEWSDEEAIQHLVNALIQNKNTAIRALEKKRKPQGKLLDFKR